MKKLYFFVLVCLASLLHYGSFAQSTPELIWSKTYNGIYSDVNRLIAATSDGGFILVGDSESYGPGILSALLIKCNSNGDVEWQKTYGGSNFDLPMAVAQTSDGGYAIATYSNSFPPEGMNMRIIKTDALGETQWASVVPGTNGIAMQVRGCLLPTPDNGFLVTGNKWSPPNANQIILCKLDNAGELLWTKEFGGSSDEYGATIQATADGNFVLGGYTYTFGNGMCDGYMIKINPDGEEIWNSVVGGTDYDSYHFIRTVSDGYIGVGSAQSYGNSEQGFIVKLDNNGQLVWLKDFGGINNESFDGIIETVNHEYLVSGTTNSYGNGMHDYLIMRISNSGELIAMETYGGADEDFGTNIEEIHGLGYISGGSFTDSYLDFQAILFQADSISTNVGQLPFVSSAISINASPNPFSETLHFGFSLRESTELTISLITMEGKSIDVIYEGNLSAGEHEMNYKNNNLEPGMYLLSIQSSKQSVMKKIIRIQ
jgi:hypothetical protein